MWKDTPLPTETDTNDPRLKRTWKQETGGQLWTRHSQRELSGVQGEMLIRGDVLNLEFRKKVWVNDINLKYISSYANIQGFSCYLFSDF